MEKSAGRRERGSHTAGDGVLIFIICVIITVVIFLEFIFLDRQVELALLRRELKRRGSACW